MTTYDTLHRAMLEDPADRAIPRWIAEVLFDVADGRGDIAAVRHPLGFICFPLERTGERGICVHVWSDRLTHARPTTSKTHAHSWDLLSFVLYGSLRNELVGVTDADDRPTHRVFEVGTRPDGDEIRRTPRLVRRHPRASELHRRGEVYSLPAGVFHESKPQGETATVALGRGHPGAVDLTLGAIDTETHRVRRQLCDREETAFAAALVARQVAELADVPEQRHREDRCEHCRP